MRPLLRMLAIALLAAISVTTAGSVADADHSLRATAAVPSSPDCVTGTDATAIAAADRIMSGRLQLGVFPAFKLPADPTWREDIGRDSQLGFQYHTLRWTLPLLQAWHATGATRYRDRAAFLLRDWARTNPRGRSPSRMAWDPHASGWRATVYACAVADLGRPAWLVDALSRHGLALADSGFYEAVGNHAVNESIGLLEVGLRLSRLAWVDLAIRRLGRVASASIDRQGVMNEGAIFYEKYWYDRVALARQRIRASGRPVPVSLARIDLMPVVLAHATLPDSTYEMIGDTGRSRAAAIPGTIAEYAATMGRSGPAPSTRFITLSRGFAFGRSGWGTRRTYTDEISYSLRFGPAPRTAHQHDDAGALTLYGYGSRLLLDPGFYGVSGSWRRFFVSRAAHNVVTVAGLASLSSGSTMRTSATSTMRLYRISGSPYAGVRLERRVLWSIGGEYLLVEDQGTATRSRSFVQRWHLVEDAAPLVRAGVVWTRRARGNVLIRQLAGGSVRIVRGSTSPVQGWISYRYGSKVAGPVMETRRSGSAVRFLTLIVPSASSAPPVSTSQLKLFADGYRVRVRIGNRVEQVVVRATSASVTVLGAPAPAPTPTPTP